MTRTRTRTPHTPGRASETHPRRPPCCSLLLLLLPLLLPPHAHGASQSNVTVTLARELAGEGRHKAAAVEFRRAALEQEDGPWRAGYYWAAAHQYWRAGEYDDADRMLDRAEAQDDAIRAPALLLRAETSREAGRADATAFYLDTILNGRPTPEVKRLASRRLAAARVATGSPDAARAILDDPALDSAAAIAALDAYAAGRDKSPRLGGMLGLVPGLGHAYSGEYANALRSLLLNALFIFGMADTAGDEEWGAFAAISFFELTWYTGSVYGGIDAAYRHNERRRRACVESINGAASFTPDLLQLPIISLQFHF